MGSNEVKPMGGGGGGGAIGPGPPGGGGGGRGRFFCIGILLKSINDPELDSNFSIYTCSLWNPAKI